MDFSVLKFQLEKDIADLASKKSAITTQKKQYELKLSILSNRIRTNKNLPQDEYEDICNEQDKCKIAIQNLQIDIDEFNKQIRDKSIEKESIQLELGKGKANLLKSDSIIESLKFLKTKYMGFAGDYTRVSSTRIMATKFVEDLDDLIKKYN